MSRINVSVAITGLLLVAAPLAYAQSQSVVNGHETYAREANDLRLGPNGLQKCQAFRNVRKHTEALQAADHGTLTRADTQRLMHELARAKAMSPHRLTAARCGVII